MGNNPSQKRKCCKNCGHVTCYGSGKYECQKRKVDMNGICDRFQPMVSSFEIMRLIDKKIAELETYEDGQFKLKKYPPFGQNYHVIGAQ